MIESARAPARSPCWRCPRPTRGRRSKRTSRSPRAPRRWRGGCWSAGRTVVTEDGARPLAPEDIGLSATHRVMNTRMLDALGDLAGQGVRVDTPERWQGLEREVMIVVHPLSGVVRPSAFDLSTGRLCVMASRHRVGLVMVTRDHVGDDAVGVPAGGGSGGGPARRGGAGARAEPAGVGAARGRGAGGAGMTGGDVTPPTCPPDP